MKTVLTELIKEYYYVNVETDVIILLVLLMRTFCYSLFALIYDILH